MYPPVTQFQTRRQELERELQAIRQTEHRRPANHRPPRYKMALLTWAGAYALITAVLAVLGPAMASWPLMVRTLVLSVTMVVVLTWLVLPCLTRLFRGWLAPTS
jgi:antibiotic biosynthesis monooxygenase (ABM) superfamily enzyme